MSEALEPKATTGRTVVVGDIHGCREELEALLSLVRFAEGDRLVSVGDTVVRGPDPGGVVRLLRSLGALAVRGNHEDRLLRRRAESKPVSRVRIAATMTQKTAVALEPEDFNWLAQLPYLLPLPEHDVVVVHAGIVPDVPLHRQKPRVLMNIRSLGDRGEPVEERGRPGWAVRYPADDGDRTAPHILFGHHALSEPQIHVRATGLDTGCVYGGRLTAMVLEPGQPPPPRSQRAGCLYSVAARQRWAEV